MWVPNDDNAFKQAYLAGATNDDLAKLFNGSLNKVLKYISQKQVAGDLPKRGEFTPTNDIPQGLSVSDEIDLRLLAFLKTKPIGIDVIELANRFDVSPQRIKDSITRLGKQHYLVSMADDTIMFCPPAIGGHSEHYIKYSSGNTFKFGLISDTHLCSKYEDLETLNTLYDYFVEEGVDTVLHAGNLIDGESKFNKRDIHTAGITGQSKYFVLNYPYREGINTYYITGKCHEGWYQEREGIDIGEYLEMRAIRAGRTDLHYLGYMEHTFIPKDMPPTRICLAHPGGGSAYATSYKPQKIVESIEGGRKPHILCIGHYHKIGWFRPRNVHCILASCTQRQTPFMRSKQLGAEVGGYIVTVKQADDGSVLGLNVDARLFYDAPGKYESWEYVE